MLNYFKYLPVGQEDESWGLEVLTAGYARIRPNEEYPSREHPGNHYFNWDKGRVLNDCYAVYITSGNGYFQSRQCDPIEIREGTVMMLYPGEWHRYKPEESTGWDEYWVGFNGIIMKDLMSRHFFHPSDPLLQIGIQDNLLQIFRDIIDSVKSENPGYQAQACGAVMYLLGSIHASLRRKNNIATGNTEVLIGQARMLMLAGLERPVSPEQIADELNVSYSWFRKSFKAVTGLAPGQYILQLKIERAIQLLADPGKSVKEVAYELNFESAFYFSALFKKKLGVSPEQYRARFLRA